MNGTLAPFNWDTEVKKYDLYEITPGVVVMKRNANGRGPVSMNEPDHELCPDCFGQHRKSFLQHDPASPYRTCAPCRHEYFWGLPQAAKADAVQPSAAEVLAKCTPAITIDFEEMMRNPPLPPGEGFPTHWAGVLDALVMTRAIVENLSKELTGYGASGSTIGAIDELIIKKKAGAL